MPARKPEIDFSIIVPVYNSERNLKPLTSRLALVFGKLAKTYEIVLIDDYSRDRSRQVITKLAKNNPHIKYLFLTRNFGQHNALFAGFNNCQGSYVITVDDDLQHPPEEVPKLIKVITSSNKYDVVYGQYEAKRHSYTKNIASRFTNLLIKKLTSSSYQITSSRIFSKQVKEEIIQYKGSLVTVSSLINRTIPPERIGICRTIHNSRANDRSNYRLGKLVIFFLKQLTLYSLEPLFWPAYFGLLFFLISILVGIILIALSFFEQQALNLILNILFAFGVVVASFLVLLLGLASTYLAHLVSIAQGWPQYKIRESNIKDYK